MNHDMAVRETDPAQRYTAPQRNMGTCKECHARKIMGNVCRIAGLENKNGERPTREVAARAGIDLSTIPANCVNGYTDVVSPPPT